MGRFMTRQDRAMLLWFAVFSRFLVQIRHSKRQSFVHNGYCLQLFVGLTPYTIIDIVNKELGNTGNSL